jgi:uncharacterized membrane protein
MSNTDMPDSDVPRAETRTPQILYALYLAGLVTANLTTLIGVVFAYVYRKDAAPSLKEHYRYLIRTFWIGLLYFCIVFTLSVLTVVGSLLGLLLAAWLGMRCVTGWLALRKGEQPARPGSWLW